MRTLVKLAAALVTVFAILFFGLVVIGYKPQTQLADAKICVTGIAALGGSAIDAQACFK